MSGEKRESALSVFECQRVQGGVWLRVVLAGVGASGVISTDETRTMARELIQRASEPPPQPKPKRGAS